MNSGVVILLANLSAVAFGFVGYFLVKTFQKKFDELIIGLIIIGVALCNMFFFNINVNIMVYASALLTSLWMFMMKKSIDHTDFKKELENLKSSNCCISEKYFKLLRHKTFEDVHLIECATFIIVLICTLIFEVSDLVKRILANVPLFFCGVHLIADFANKKWMEKICEQDEHKLKEN